MQEGEARQFTGSLLTENCLESPSYTATAVQSWNPKVPALAWQSSGKPPKPFPPAPPSKSPQKNNPLTERSPKKMTKIETVRAAMVTAMKNKDKARKDALSMLLSVLKNAEIDKRSPLTEDEENAIVKKEIKQCQETIDTAPKDRTDIKEEAALRISVYKEFAPEDMSVDQIKEVIQSVLTELKIEHPTPADKGKIMKILMPKVKGKADGKLVNQTLASMLH